MRLCLVALLALGACAGVPGPEAWPAGVPRRAEIDGVPRYVQQADHCGPAALAMALAWSGLEVSPRDIAPAVFTPGRDGSLPPDMLTAARRSGRLVVPIEGWAGLVAEIAGGHPVVVLRNLGLSWRPQWHYAVVVGYDLDAGEIALHSGGSEVRTTGIDTFGRTWARAGRWGVVVVPPGRLPASADDAAVMRAASALERAGQPAAALRTYRALLKRTPDQLAPRVGLGNVLYALDRRDEAERAFRVATLLHPRSAAAWNNLAHVLNESGLASSATQAASEAARLSGEDDPVIRATREAILARAARR